MPDTEIMARLERLERDNRRLKAFAIATAIVAAALAAMNAARPVPDKITAHEFDVVDNAGKARVEIRLAHGKGPLVQLNDANGLGRLQLLRWAAGPQITLSNDQDRDDIDILASNLIGPSITVWNSEHTGYAAVELAGHDPATVPNIELKDGKGFLMDLGSASTTKTTTGATQQTSAASIVMFGNDKKHHVIWQAP